MAIAETGAATGTPGSTWSHTISGSNTLLIVGIRNTGDNVSAVTYNSVGMSQLNKVQIPSGDWNYVYGLINPTTGSNTVAITSSGGLVSCDSVGYSGVKQTGLPDATNVATGTSGSLASISVTTIADNCWTALWCAASTTPTAGTGTTVRRNDNKEIIADSNAVITPAGSTTMNFTTTGSAAAIIVSFAPPSSSVNNFKTVTGALSFVGTGPQKAIGKKSNLTGVLSFYGGGLPPLNHAFSKAFTAVLSFTGSMSKGSRKNLSAALSFVGSVSLVATLLRRFRPSSTLLLSGPTTTRFIQ